MLRLEPVAPIMRGKGSGGYDYISNVGPVRHTVPNIAAQSTLDTPEHRWLALQLSELRHQLRTINAALAAEARSSGLRTIGLRCQTERPKSTSFCAESPR